MVYWDVRPSSRYPTVEVRAADVPSTVAETVLLATLTRAAVMTALDEFRRGVAAPRVAAETLRAAYWKAARDGLDGQTVDVTRRLRPVPTRDLLGEFVEHLRPALDGSGRIPPSVRRVAAPG